MPYYSNNMYTNINEIVDRIKRHPLMEDMPFETALAHAIDFIKIAGTPVAMIEKTAVVKIEDYRGILPDDLCSIIQVRDDKGRYYRYSTDSFHLSPMKEEENGSLRATGITYKVQGSCIISSIKDGELEVAYRAIPTDREGYPLIPEGSYTKALELYIKKEWFTTQFDLGKISIQVLNNTQQQYAWAVGQAQSRVPSVDEMESIVNAWTKLIPNNHEHRKGFATNGTEQVIRTH